MAKAATSNAGGRRRGLGDVLVERGVLSSGDLEQAIAHQKQSGKGLAPAIVELGLATEEQIVAGVAAHEGLRFVDLAATEPDPSATNLLAADVARKHTVLPVGYSGDRLLLAMVNPGNTEAIEEVELLTGLTVEPAYGTRRSILFRIDEIFGTVRSESAEPASAAVEEVEDAPAPDIGQGAEPDAVRVGRRLGVDDEELPVDIHELLEQVLVRGASDLHLTAGRSPVVRIHGALRPMPEYPVLEPQHLQKMLYAVLTQKQRERFESELDLDFSYSVPGVSRFRGNMFIQRGAFGAVFRIIPFEVKPIDDLGMPPQVREFARLPRGLVLVTGPTGSGKSTTLAAIIDVINNEEPVHIMTVEDPIEFLHNHKTAVVNQREVGEDVHTFAKALKHVLRQDPDVILVGEMRDLETTQLAITAAETGHLVFATLHTQDAPQTVDRVIDQFPPHQQQQIRVQLAGSLQGVLSQQLLPTADGAGRAVACEVLVATPAVRNLIREGKTHQIYSSMQAGGQFGMQTMDSHLAQHVRSGKITQALALERCHNAEELITLIGAQVPSQSGRSKARSR